MEKYTTITDRSKIERYFEYDINTRIDKIKHPVLEIWLHTAPGENTIQSAGYILAEQEDIAETPEIDDDLHGVIEFLAEQPIPRFEDVIVNGNNLILFHDGQEGQLYIHYNFQNI